MSSQRNTPHAFATLGGGCFWCVEAVIERVPGVIAVVSGYAGGALPHPTYQQVCGGRTGHAEVVQIEYDPALLKYEELLEVFWRCHDPTTQDRQGADEGTQYRSIILYADAEQRRLAEDSKKQLEKSGRFADPVVTEIAPLKTFYAAEPYHQDYYRLNPRAPYCAHVIHPKLKKLGMEK